MSNNSRSSRPAPVGLSQSLRSLAPPNAGPSRLSELQQLISQSEARVRARPNHQIRPPQAGELSDRLNTALLSEQEKEALVRQTEALLRDIKTGNKKVETREDLLTAVKRLVEFKQPAEAEYEDRDRWLEARRLFVQKYDKARPEYEIFTQNVRNECERILKAQVPVILHQDPSSRTKKVDSLEKKVKKEIPHLRSEGSDKSPMVQLYENIMDLAGIRILVYFPDDVSRVVRAIDSSDTIEIVRSGVTYSSNRTDHRAVDKSDKSVDRVGLIYTYGAFQEEVKSMSTNEIIRRWKNSGYRAVHLRVKMTAADATEIDGADPELELYSEETDEEMNSVGKYLDSNLSVHMQANRSYRQR
jgi:ppGpp synthetase/RelA/SpoT-type nucleotidyltranferase